VGQDPQQPAGGDLGRGRQQRQQPGPHHLLRSPGQDRQLPEKINHYNVLRTLEQAHGLPYVGSSATATPITDAWQ
jgi:hypothetical protein